IVVEAPDDALAQAQEVVDAAALEGLQRRVEGAQEEGADDLDFLEDLAPDTRAEAFEVDGDVGEFGHGFGFARGLPVAIDRHVGPAKFSDDIANEIANCWRVFLLEPYQDSLRAHAR